MFKFEDLMEVRKMEFVKVMEWLKAHGCEESDLDVEIDEDGWGQIDVGGYWSDAHPVIEFEDGVVARWYRSEDWD